MISLSDILYNTLTYKFLFDYSNQKSDKLIEFLFIRFINHLFNLLLKKSLNYSLKMIEKYL